MKSFSLALLFVAVASMCCIQSCQIDDDNDSDGDAIAKFLGTWKVSDQSGRINYEVTIVRNPSNSAEVRLENFADDGGVAIGLVVSNTIIIDEQQIGPTFTSSGEGSYVNASRLEFGFTLNDGIEIQNRIAVFTK